MKSLRVSFVALGLVTTLVFGLWAQPGGDKGPGKKGPPRYELGKVLPPFVRDELELTEEQVEQIADLEREVHDKLAKILTAKQQKLVEEMVPKGPKGPVGGKGKGQ